LHRIEPFDEEHLAQVLALCAAEGWQSWTVERVSRAFAAPGVIAVGRALIADLFIRSGLDRIDLLSTDEATSFYESFSHKTKPGSAFSAEIRNKSERVRRVSGGRHKAERLDRRKRVACPVEWTDPEIPR